MLAARVHNSLYVRWLDTDEEDWAYATIFRPTSALFSLATAGEPVR